jgi:simple sugar transport system permease protein
MKLLRELFFPLLAVLAAFVIGGILILLIGDSPIQAYRLLIGSAFSWPDGIGLTLFYATPLIFTGLAVLVAFRCGLLNIGAEGQLYVAAFATAWVGITFANLSAWLLLPLCFLAAIVGGGAWGAIPGILKARFGSHEVINTIMLNFIGIAVISYFIQYHYKKPGDPIMQSTEIGSGAHVARLGKFVPGLPERIPLNLAFFLALLCCPWSICFFGALWGGEGATGASPIAHTLQYLD